MAIDIIARGLATSLLGSDGKISSSKMPTLQGTSELTGFYPLGKLTDPSLIEGRTVEEILLMMLFGVVNPAYTAPGLTISLDQESLPLIVGRPSVLKGALHFDRGSIDPAYGTSGYRAGVATSYSINGETYESSDSKYEFELTLTPSAGDMLIEYNVQYAEGEQPLNSIGQPVDSPLAAGAITGSITVPTVYMLYNSGAEEVEFTWFEEDDGEGYMSTFASEGSGIQQSFAIAKDVTVIGIKAFDVMTQQWTWLGGQTAAVSLTHFDTTIISGESLGEATDYILYTHNQPASGERELRIYVM